MRCNSLDGFPNRHQTKLREHHKRFEKDRSGPPDIRPKTKNFDRNEILSILELRQTELFFNHWPMLWQGWQTVANNTQPTVHQNDGK
jgi:hypothetical protein